MTSVYTAHWNCINLHEDMFVLMVSKSSCRIFPNWSFLSSLILRTIEALKQDMCCISSCCFNFLQKQSHCLLCKQTNKFTSKQCERRKWDLSLLKQTTKHTRHFQDAGYHEIKINNPRETASKMWCLWLTLGCSKSWWDGHGKHGHSTEDFLHCWCRDEILRVPI